MKARKIIWNESLQGHGQADEQIPLNPPFSKGEMGSKKF
jgi:hypothetical protein